MTGTAWPSVHRRTGPWSADDLARMTESGFQHHLGIRLLAADPSCVRLELPLDQRHANSTGIVHGGVLMALADSAGAMGALLNLPEGARTATLDSQTHFLRPAYGPRLLVEAVPVHLGRTRFVWRSRVLSEPDRLCAEITQTQIILRQMDERDDHQ